MPRKGVVLSPEAAARQAESIKKWQKENTTQLCLRVRKEKTEAYKELAEKKGVSLSALIQNALDSMM